MGKGFGFLLSCVVIVMCVLELTLALDCLFCKSSVLDSECRLGTRKYKPKLNRCIAPNAKCFALAKVSVNGTVKFSRGCTIYPDYCNKQRDVEFCQTCGSKFCNFWVMDVSTDGEGLLNNEKEAALGGTTKKLVFNTERLRKRSIFDDVEKKADDDSSLSVGVKENEEEKILA